MEERGRVGWGGNRRLEDKSWRRNNVRKIPPPVEARARKGEYRKVSSTVKIRKRQ